MQLAPVRWGAYNTIIMDYYDEVNKKRLSYYNWVYVLKLADSSRDPSAMDIFKFTNQQPDKTVTGQQLSDHFKVDVGTINLELGRFGKEALAHTIAPDQKRTSGSKKGDNIYWNIPFTNDKEKQEAGEGNFSWTLRPELVRALEVA